MVLRFHILGRKPKAQKEISSKQMKELGFVKHSFCFVTLGLLCGWYYFLMIAVPLLVYFCFRGSLSCQIFSGSVLSFFIVATYWPLSHKPWEAFMYSFVFDWWRDYFDLTYDNTTIAGDNALKIGTRYIFFEFPHGIFPMGQFLSSSLIRELTPGHMVCGTAADVLFKIPVMRQLMAWLGTQPASRKNITKIFQQGYQGAVIPGGIAEMYVISDTAETIYFTTRKNTVKAAIQEGAHIIPLFAFGNTKLFTIPSGSSSDNTSNNSSSDSTGSTSAGTSGQAKKKPSGSMLQSISRKMRASIIFFYGRWFLPVPYRHPIKLVTGDIVRVVQSDNPTDEEIATVMNAVIASINKLYKEKKPDWEHRPLVIL